MTSGGRTTQQFLLKSFWNHVIRKDAFSAGATYLTDYWYVIRPTSMTVQTSFQRFVLGGHSMAYFLLVCMQATSEETASNVVFTPAKGNPGTEKTLAAFNTRIFLQLFQLLPDEILPPYRKKRAYISSILALNEVDKDSPYSKHVFQRVGHGWYTINPDLRITNDSY